jgi:hypothetical protein
MSADRAARRASLRRLWKPARKARPALKMARDAEDYWVLDREQRSLATVLELPDVVVYVVEPGGAGKALFDPRIQTTFELGQPVIFCFARHEDAIEMRNYGRRLKLAATPSAAMGRA